MGLYPKNQITTLLPTNHGFETQKWTLKEFSSGFYKNFPEVFQKAARESLLPDESLLPERASCQREPAARESLLPESQRVPGCAEKCQGSDESATKCQKAAAEDQREPGWTPKDFPQVFPKTFS